MTTLPKLSKRAEDAVVAHALDILEIRAARAKNLLSTPETVEKFLKLKLGFAEREMFGILFLNIKNKLVHDEILFSGTLAHTQVYPREVVKKALECNASAVILYHNHPSGDTTPSASDLSLTKELKAILKNIDVRVVDHIIVAGAASFSFAERGMM